MNKAKEDGSKTWYGRDDIATQRAKKQAKIARDRNLAILRAEKITKKADQDEYISQLKEQGKVTDEINKIFNEIIKLIEELENTTHGEKKNRNWGN